MSTDEQFWFFLQNETYRHRGEGFRVNSTSRDWDFHLLAAKHDLGAPLARSVSSAEYIRFNNIEYGFQVFARSTLYNPIPIWNEVHSLYAVTRGRIPQPGKFERYALDASYKLSIRGSLTPPRGSQDIHADWAFHKVAEEQNLGPALSGNYIILIENQTYAIQVFAKDTLYSSGPPYLETNFLSNLGPNSPLYNALWIETYKPCNEIYDPNSPFQREAVKNNIGTPLSGVYEAKFEGIRCVIQVFAFDTLYTNATGEIHKLSSYKKPKIITDYTTPSTWKKAIVGDIIPSSHSVTSHWIEEKPNTPERIQKLIFLALKMLGDDKDVFPLLTKDRQNALSYTPGDIGCADLVSFCLQEAGVNLRWTVNHPTGTQYNGPRAANYYRPFDGHPSLREVARDEPWLPGDILVYGKTRAGEYHHVNLYVGDYTGQDVSGRVHERTKGYDVVDAHLYGPSIYHQTKEYCIQQHYAPTYSFCIRMRHKEIEDMYRNAGII